MLYHYTSLESLFAIINGIDVENQQFTLRATHASFLNDFSEGQLIPMALERLGANYKTMSLLQNTLGFPFVVSLSDLNNDLNMWRCYANVGKGISIGLDKKEFELAVNNNNCRLGKCKYLTIDELVNILKENGVDKIIKNKDIKPLFKILGEMLEYKHKSFQAEKEWRVYDFNFETGFRVSDNLIIPFREIRIPVSSIKTITLGPKCDYVRNEYGIYRFLKSKIRYLDLSNIDIKSSDIPLQ